MQSRGAVKDLTVHWFMQNSRHKSTVVVPTNVANLMPKYMLYVCPQLLAVNDQQELEFLNVHYAANSLNHNTTVMSNYLVVKYYKACISQLLYSVLMKL